MNTLEALAYVNFKNVPEGWHGLAITLLEKILDTAQDSSNPTDAVGNFTIESIDINKSGKLVVTGLHIKSFENEIIEVAKIAEHVCCICGNYGRICQLPNQINLPLCSHHGIAATSH